jgi:hypothetical protein
MDSRKQAPTLQ